MVAAAIDPAGEGHALADVGQVEFTAGVGLEHNVILAEKGPLQAGNWMVTGRERVKTCPLLPSGICV
jgi:hypothetical protein